MKYYKIIKNNVVIDVNYSFFQFLPKRHRIVSCEFKDAELIQSSDQEKFYITDWLRPLPENAPYFEKIDAKQITKEEYDELYEKLKIGESIESIDEEIKAASLEIAQETEIKIEKEEIMDYTSMRKKIAELESLVNKLLNKD